ncbi:MAG: universal stress protein [Gemmatimonadota bacterium]|nr:universal stress protein [Gemmatimonadota bacterium]
MKQVMVALDGSSFAEQALGPAIDIANRAGGRLDLVSVCNPADAGPALADVELSLEEEVSRYLDDVREKIGPHDDLEVEARVLTGYPAAALVEEVEERRVDLAVLSTHGRGPVSRAWLGSVADRFVREAPCPVLLVRPDETDGAADFNEPFEVRHVVVPMDGSEVGEAVLERAAEMARLFGARITLFSAVGRRELINRDFVPHVEYVTYDRLLSDRVAQARTELEEIRERLRTREITADVVVVEDSNPATAILEFVSSEKPDLVAMGTHGRKGMARMVLGSVADKVVRSATTPVLLVRPPWEE